MSFKSFLGKLAGEYLGISTALESIASGIALPVAEKAKVVAVIDMLNNAAESITGGLDTVSERPVQISKTDLEKIVSAVIEPMVEKAVADALAKNAEATK